MFLDTLFHFWRRLSGPLQWWSLWLLNSKFMVTVAGVVLDGEGRVLLQRHRHWVPEVWGLPGGIVHSGERLEEAFAREVREETGLRLAEIALVRLNSGFRLRLEVFFRARLASGPQALRLQEKEVLEVRFFALDDLPVEMLPLHRALVESIRAGSTSTAGTGG